MRLGIFADFPQASTGFAIVCHNLAKELAAYFDLEIYYFGRFGLRKNGFASKSELTEDGYNYVPCIGGVWDNNYVTKLIKKWELDCLFSEDDWFSSGGLIVSSKQTEKPLHLLTPIDCLPLPINALRILKNPAKVYVPNSSHHCLPNSVYLPHGVDKKVFYPMRRRNDEITFLWIGRDETRKALGRTLLAFRNVLEKTHFPVDLKLLVRTDWKNSKSQLFIQKNMRNNVIMEQTSDVPHEQLNNVYNRGHIFVCSSKAGGFEMGIIEANATGIPALVTNHPFMNELIMDGLNGWKVDISGLEPDPRDNAQGIGQWGIISIDDLTSKMLWCIENIDQIQKLQTAMIPFVTARFNWKSISKTLYDNLMESSKQ